MSRLSKGDPDPSFLKWGWGQYLGLVWWWLVLWGKGNWGQVNRGCQWCCLQIKSCQRRAQVLSNQDCKYIISKVPKFKYPRKLYRDSLSLDSNSGSFLYLAAWTYPQYLGNLWISYTCWRVQYYFWEALLRSLRIKRGDNRLHLWGQRRKGCQVCGTCS